MYFNIKVYGRHFINILFYYYKSIWKPSWTMQIQSFGFEMGLLKYANVLGDVTTLPVVVLTDNAAIGKSGLQWQANARWTVTGGLIMWDRNQGYLHPGNRWHRDSTMKIHRLLMKEMNAGGYKSQAIDFWGEIIGWVSNNLACHPQHLLPLLLYHLAPDDKFNRMRVSAWELIPTFLGTIS